MALPLNQPIGTPWTSESVPGSPLRCVGLNAVPRIRRRSAASGAAIIPADWAADHATSHPCRGTRGDSGSIISSVNGESTVRENRARCGEGASGRRDGRRPGPRGSGPPPAGRVRPSDGRSFATAHSRSANPGSSRPAACSMKCQEISLATTFRKVIRNLGSARAGIDGDRPAIGEGRLGVIVVDLLGFLGLILDRLILAVLGIIHLEGLDMDLGLAMEHVQVAGDLGLELLDLEEDDDVGVEVAGDLGRVGLLGVGLDPGRDLVGVDDRDLLDLLPQDRGEFPAQVALQRGYSPIESETARQRITTFLPWNDGLASAGRSSARRAGGNRPASAGRNR